MNAKDSKACLERMAKDSLDSRSNQYGADEKARIVLEGLRGKGSIADLCRMEGIAKSRYYYWSKQFIEAGKRQLAADPSSAINSYEVRDLRREVRDLKQIVVEQALELQLQKGMIGNDNVGDTCPAGGVIKPNAPD